MLQDLVHEVIHPPQLVAVEAAPDPQDVRLGGAGHGRAEGGEDHGGEHGEGALHAQRPQELLHAVLVPGHGAAVRVQRHAHLHQDVLLADQPHLGGRAFRRRRPTRFGGVRSSGVGVGVELPRAGQRQRWQLAQHVAAPEVVHAHAPQPLGAKGAVALLAPGVAGKDRGASARRQRPIPPLVPLPLALEPPPALPTLPLLHVGEAPLPGGQRLLVHTPAQRAYAEEGAARHGLIDNGWLSRRVGEEGETHSFDSHWAKCDDQHTYTYLAVEPAPLPVRQIPILVRLAQP